TEWSPEMVAFDATTGERLWKYNSPDPANTRWVLTFGRAMVTETVAHFEETEVPRQLDTGEPAGRFPLPVSAMLPDDRLFNAMPDEEAPAGAYDWRDLDERWTDEFIYPPYDFTITEQMITNLHPPRSSLVVMASAFTDFELLHEAYKEAYEKEYRLFTFGDAMLIR
ncbi:MAG: hypothetical protein BRD30_06830, partial [Bacteroidetes bacterium QH_2_63_10]